MLTNDTRNHDGLGKQSPLLRGMPIYPLSTPIREVIRTRALMQACVWYDAGEAAWTGTDAVESRLLRKQLRLGHN
ncbi:MAG TPA: hypothetical protein VI542_34970 [Candidatus Tectomicrobia bacterium]